MIPLKYLKLIDKLLMTRNPSKNFLYTEFYLPWKRKELEPHKKFLQTLVYDNPFISDIYIRNLQKKPKGMRERLLFGNWEYDDDPSKLIDYEAMQDLFTNIIEEKESDPEYIVADVARKGEDKTTVSYWKAWIS